MTYFSSVGIIMKSNPCMMKETLRISYAKDILQSVARYYGMSVEDVLKKTRKPDIIMVRQVAIYCIGYKIKGIYLKEIASVFGKELNFDHTIVIYSRSRIEAQLSAKFDNQYKDDISNILLIL